MGYSNSEVAHRFATGIGERCTGSHMFFEGNVIYSYGHHFPMAIKWNGYVLYNDDSYSVSTSKHQGYVLGACSHMDIVHCATLEHWNTWESKPTKGFIDKNLHLWEHEVFDLAVPEAFYKFRVDEEVEKARVAAKEMRKAAAAIEAKRQAEEIQKFHEFKKNWVNLPYQIVRYREDKNRFETSKNVQIPYETGLEFYRKLRDGQLKVGDKVLYYTVNRVAETISIGCHTFKKKYLLEYGKLTSFGIMNTSNNHDEDLVRDINVRWVEDREMFKPILCALYERDIDEITDADSFQIPAWVDTPQYRAGQSKGNWEPYMAMALRDMKDRWEDFAENYLMHISDNQDLEAIIKFVRYDRSENA